MKEKILLSSLFYLGIVSPFFTQTQEEWLSFVPGEAKELLETNSYVFHYGKPEDLETDSSPELIFLPDSPQASLISDSLKSIKPDTLIEGLYILPALDSTDTEENLLAIFNSLLQVRQLDGTKYFSFGSQDYEVLFSNVYRVGSSKKRKDKIPDSTVDILPKKESIYINLKERRLGQDIYQLNYEVLKDSKQISFEMENLSTMSFILPVVEPGNLSLNLQVFVLDDAVVVYSATFVKFQNKGMINAIMDPYSSFQRRTHAYIIWLENTLYQLPTKKLPPKEIIVMS